MAKIIVWKLVYKGYLMFDKQSLHGDPLIGLLCSRDSGVFTPSEDSLGSEDWVLGKLVTVTKKGDRTISAFVLGRKGGEWSWIGNPPGTRHCDFKSILDREIEVQTDKPISESTFGKELIAHGWVEA